MSSDQPKNFDRRDFLKLLGLSSAASMVALSGCKLKKQMSPDSSKPVPVPTDKMTYRVNPKTGNEISLLGYGCMRLPKIPEQKSQGKANDIGIGKNGTEYREGPEL